MRDLAGFDEKIYWIAGHANETGKYGGGVYVKRDQKLGIAGACTATDLAGRTPRHFCFVRGDFCYEVLGFSEPNIRDSLDDASAWGTASKA
jgi:hypothetical protein